MGTLNICVLFFRCFTQLKKKISFEKTTFLWVNGCRSMDKDHGGGLRITLIFFFSLCPPTSFNRESPCVPGACQATGTLWRVRPFPDHKYSLWTENMLYLQKQAHCISNVGTCCCYEYKSVGKQYCVQNIWNFMYFSDCNGKGPSCGSQKSWLNTPALPV